jgi:hypothetical protein
MIDIFIPVSNDDIFTDREIDGKRVCRINDSVITWLNGNASISGYYIIWNVNEEEGCIFRFINSENELAFLRECVLTGDD